MRVKPNGSVTFPLALLYLLLISAGIAAGQDTLTSVPENNQARSDSINPESARTSFEGMQPQDSMTITGSAFDRLRLNQEILQGKIDSVTSAVNQLPGDQGYEQPWWIYVALTALAMLTVIFAGISYSLYRWPELLVGNPNARGSSKKSRSLSKVDNQLKKLAEVLKKKLTGIESATADNSSRIENMTETYMSLQKALDDKDSEIERLKKGYDSEVYRRFLHRFIRVSQTIEELIEDGDVHVNDLDAPKRLLDDAFLECGVERFSPGIGDDYTTAKGVSDHPKTIVTKNKKDEFKIAEIVEEGYVLKSGEKDEILVPAKVKIYVTKNQQEK